MHNLHKQNNISIKIAFQYLCGATIYSIIETAKANNLVPFKYLQFLLEKLTTGDQEINIDDLLPWNVKL